MKPRPAARWAALTPAYRGRLESRGVTREHYIGGTPLTAARGHAVTPEHPGRTLPWIRQALRLGIHEYIHPAYWDRMSAKDRTAAAHDYVLGYFTRGQGARLTREERKQRGLLPQDRNVYRHRSHEQELAQVHFQQLMVEVNGHMWDKAEWKEFRSNYYTKFAA